MRRYLALPSLRRQRSLVAVAVAGSQVAADMVDTPAEEDNQAAEEDNLAVVEDNLAVVEGDTVQLVAVVGTQAVQT